MCSRTTLPGLPSLAFCAVIVAFLPAGAGAQTIPELRQRVLELERAYAAADAIADSIESMLGPVIQTETMPIGYVTLVAIGTDMSFIREAAAEAQRILAHELGPDGDVLKGVSILLILSENGRATVGPISRARSTGGFVVDDPVALAKLLVEGTYQTVDLEHDRTIRDWLVTRTPNGSTEYSHQRSAYSDLAASPFVSAQACLAGDIGECRRALGLIATSDGLMTWYDPADRVQMAQQRSAPSARFYPRRSSIYDGCVERGEDASCRDFLASSHIEPPLPPSIRETIVLEALRTGGEGAYGRLRRASGTVEQRLAAAAGVSGDSLITIWRAALIDAAGQPTAATLPIGSAAVFWTLVFAALGLRSTRWR